LFETKQREREKAIPRHHATDGKAARAHDLVEARLTLR
jgi:hypothetical protein